MNGIDRVVPINEAHRERLDRLQANLEKLQARHEKEMAVHGIEVRMARESAENAREIAELCIALNEEIRDAFFESRVEQTLLIRRIVEKCKA